MLFERKKPDESAKPYFTNHWDERLYRALFSHRSGGKLPRAHHFKCLLNERELKLELPGPASPVHKYNGSFKLWPSDFEFCEVTASVSFESPHDYYDVLINPFPVGCAQFNYASHDSRDRPAIELRVRATGPLAEAVGRMFFENRAVGGEGVIASWSVVLGSMAGLSAAEAWGDWNERAEFDEQGRRVSAVPAGRELPRSRHSPSLQVER